MKLTEAQFSEMVSNGQWGFYQGSFSLAKPIPQESKLLPLPPGAEIEQESDGYIAILIPKIRKEQRKKIDGGGFNEIPYMGVSHRLVHIPTLTAAREERRRQDTEAQEALVLKKEVERERVKMERERAAKEAKARIESFLGALKNVLLGAKLTEIVAGQDFLVLRFDNGHTMEVHSYDYEQYCSWLSINGIRMDDGQPQKDT